MTHGVRITYAISFEGWRISERGWQHLEQLFAQLSPYQGRPFTPDVFKRLTNQSHYLIAEDHERECAIVGMVRLVSQIDQTSHRHYGVLHDEVVNPGYRGRGIGTALTQAAIVIAKKFAYIHVDAFVKAKPTRISANKMYVSLDFELITPADPDDHESANHYRLVL